MEVDEVLSLLGLYGRWQMSIYFSVNILGTFASAFSAFAYLFQAYTPAHHCKVPEGEDISLVVPWINSSQSFSSCLVFDNSSFNNSTIECSEEINDWDYYGDVTDTIVSEWNLVCGHQYLKKMTSTVNLLGVLVGTGLFTPLMDYFGRRPIFLLCMALNLLLGVWNVFVSNYYVYLVVRFLCGIVRSGYSISSFILACELFPANQRTFAGIILSSSWGVAVCILALLMYLISNWRHLQMFIALTGLLAIPLYWLLPESVPWLITKGRVVEAERVVQAAAHINKIKNFPTSVFKPYYITKEVKEEEEEEEEEGEIMDEEKIVMKQDRNIKKSFGKGVGGGVVKRISGENGARRSGHVNLGWYSRLCHKGSTTGMQNSLLDVIKHRRLRTMTLVMCFIWFVDVIVYYGLTLNTEEMTGNRHVNLFLSGLVEIPAYTLSLFVIKKWGRRMPLVWLHILAGVSLTISQIIPKQTGGGVSLAALEITLSTIGKFSITASFGIIWLYTAELFPTGVRSQAAGVANICGRVGGMIAPFSTSLNTVFPWLMSVVFGIISIIGGLLTLLLPETNNRSLPQTIADIEYWYTLSTNSKKARTTIQTISTATAVTDHRGSVTTI